AFFFTAVLTPASPPVRRRKIKAERQRTNDLNSRQRQRTCVLRASLARWRPMSSTSHERVAVVTGAGRGIGKAIAEMLAAGGVTVVCVSRSEANCSQVADGIVARGGKARAMAVDVSDAAAVEQASARLNEEFGAVNILVNNAGITRDGMMLRMSQENWHDVINTNLSSCFYWTKGLAGPMSRKRWGRIVNITSVIGLM